MVIEAFLEIYLTILYSVPDKSYSCSAQFWLDPSVDYVEEQETSFSFPANPPKYPTYKSVFEVRFSEVFAEVTIT